MILNKIIQYIKIHYNMNIYNQLYIQQMQQKKTIQTLLSHLKTHIQNLHKFQQQTLKPHHIQNFPMKELLTFYQKELIIKLKDRSSKSESFIDILVWYLPRVMSLIDRVEGWVRKVPVELGNVVIEDEESYQNGQQIHNCTLLQKLKFPGQFLQQQIIKILQDYLQQCKNTNKPKQAQQITRYLNLFHKLNKQQKNTDLSLPADQYQRKIQSLLYEDIKNPRSRLVVKYGYRFLFMARLRVRVRRANKHINERKLRIQELIEGERKYIAGLAQYIEYIKLPISALKILTELQNKKLFSSIESILAFHKILEQQLSARFAKYHKYQTYGDFIRKNIPFFKLYTDYIEYADQAQALLLSLEEKNQQVKAICNKFMQQKQKKASDQLKQPTFRIARYQMIIKQILKNTPPTHPDHPLLKQAAKQIKVNLSKINQTVDQISRRTRLHQLQQQYGTEQRPIYTPTRNFLEQFHLQFINGDRMEPVFVFVFSDLVVVVDESRKMLRWVDVDGRFFVRREEDNKTYRNIVKLHSDGFLTFSAGNQDRHSGKADSFFKILKSISKQSITLNRMVQVHVIGTQQINTSTFNKFTEYIAQIKYLGMRKFTRLRFSLMKDFVQKIQLNYKNDLGISLDENLKDGWFSNYNSKTIQDRKRLIQQILQKMLNNPIILTTPTFILNQLGIQPSFLKPQPTPNPNQKLPTELSSPLIRLKSSQQAQKQKNIRQAETILCATDIKLGRDSYHDPSLVSKKVSESERFPILVHTMVGERPLEVRISEMYTVEDVCCEVSNMLDLKTSRDFRLFHEVGKKQLRVLDNDKKIIKLFNFPKKQPQQKPKTFYELFSAFKNLIVPQSIPKLIFKKYYYLPPQIEQSEQKKDATRLRLIVYQILSEIKEMKYNLSFQDYLLYLAILIYIQYDGVVPEETDGKYVARVIPEKVFKIKNQSEEYWIRQCQPYLVWLTDEISKIIQHNKQKIKNRKIIHDSIMHFGHRHICSQLCISKIRSSPVYGSNLFYVQLSKQTYEKFEKSGKNPVYNMWLAIKVDSLLLLSPSSKQVVLQVQIKDIQRIVVQTQGVIFKMQSLAICQYSLNTYQSFQISQLVKYYKCLAQTIEQLQNNKLLIAKAKVYKQELDNYRNSYEKAERETMAENVKIMDGIVGDE